MNSILRRRRALMEKGETDPTIYGSKLTWEQGYLSSGVLDTSYISWISTANYIKFTPGGVLTYTGPNKNENDVPYIVYAMCYDSEFNYITYWTIYNSSSKYTTCQVTSANVAYIKICYGHLSATNERTTVSEGNYFVCLVQDRSEVKNNFDGGTYTMGTSSGTVTGNRLSITAFNNGDSNALTLKFDYPLNIQTGDTVRVLIKKVSGSVSKVSFTNIYVGNNKVVNNVAWQTGNTPIDITSTVSTSNNTLTVVIQTHSVQPTYTNYAVSITIYVNGVQVLPEV